MQLMRRTDALLLASKVNIAGAVTATSKSACTCDAAHAGPREVREKPCPHLPIPIAITSTASAVHRSCCQQMNPEPVPTNTYSLSPTRAAHVGPPLTLLSSPSCSCSPGMSVNRDL
ncbi:hypothetical protein PtrV1_01132 [Pyrenophora tritici-repentis]|uniref:Uncharacterized protein n=1 Tax=Pyrenophora tritici-repentis TaxID=45151 RepID=A0A5M9LNE9_9PLEO|nr:hypothetical protein PtrV1_01132 [Pyrenophora tritici-repentis]KAF7576945.1 hypothetical protein PtrM4_011850 [Pyrenophora tritici-repentis]